MSLEQVTNIAEIAAAFATVATLVYLSIQIRKSNTLQTSESRRATINASLPLASIVGQNSESAPVFYKGMADYSNLSSEQKTQFHFLFSMLASQNELVYTDSKLGLSSWEIFKASESVFMPLLNTPGDLAYWRSQSKGHGPEYAAYISKQLDRQVAQSYADDAS
jgi:hypothetical protein